jgi:hypothetical protein
MSSEQFRDKKERHTNKDKSKNPYIKEKGGKKIRFPRLRFITAEFTQIITAKIITYLSRVQHIAAGIKRDCNHHASDKKNWHYS